MQAHVGPYRITEEIARGGMGVIFRARDPRAGREVAVKVLLAGGGAGATQRRRFAREAEALARLNHPHVVRVHTVGEHQGNPYLVMDLVEGDSLEQRLERRGPLEPKAAAALAAKLAAALQHAHEQGVVHRDVKPANVLLAGGEPRLTDFGLAKDLDSHSHLTQTGRFLGTPGYWSPEQARGEVRVGPATDVYGLGATLYALLTGRPPFSGETLIEVVSRMEAPPEPPSRLRPEVDRVLEAICLRCLQTEPEQRYPSAQALGEDLLRYLRGEAVLARSSTAAGRALSYARRRVSLPLLATALALALAIPGLLVAFSPAPAPPATPSSSDPGSGSLRPAEREARLREHLAKRRYAEGLRELAALPEAPPELAWALTRGLVERALRKDELPRAAELLRDEQLARALARGREASSAARQALARRLLEEASALHPDPMREPPPGALERIASAVELARQVLAGDELGAADVRALHELAMTRIGFDPAVDVVLAGVLVDLFRVSPDLELASRSAHSVVRNVDGDFELRLLPLVRAVAERAPTVEHRYLLARALLSVGDPREALKVSDDVLARDGLSAVDASELYQRRGTLYWHRKDFASALRERQTSYETSPTPDRLVALADALNDAGQPARALECLRKVLREVPWESGEQLFGSQRLFRLAVEALWRCDTRRADAVLMRDTLCRLLDHHPEGLNDRELWQVRAALLQLETLKTEAGRERLRRVAPDLTRAFRQPTFAQQALAITSLEGAEAVAAADRLAAALEAELVARRDQAQRARTEAELKGSR